MTLDSLPDLEYKRVVSCKDSFYGTDVLAVSEHGAPGRRPNIHTHCRPAPPRQTEALSSRTSRSRPWKRRSQAVRERKTSVLRIRGDHRLVDFRHSPLIARDDRRRPFFRAAAAEEGGARQRERNWAGRSRERPLPGAVAVAAPRRVALVWRRSEGGQQFLVDGCLDRGADVLVDQFAQRDGLELMRSCGFLDTPAHGAFLR